MNVNECDVIMIMIATPNELTHLVSRHTLT